MKNKVAWLLVGLCFSRLVAVNPEVLKVYQDMILQPEWIFWEQTAEFWANACEKFCDRYKLQKNVQPLNKCDWEKIFETLALLIEKKEALFEDQICMFCKYCQICSQEQCYASIDFVLRQLQTSLVLMETFFELCLATWTKPSLRADGWNDEVTAQMIAAWSYRLDYKTPLLRTVIETASLVVKNAHIHLCNLAARTKAIIS